MNALFYCLVLIVLGFMLAVACKKKNADVFQQAPLVIVGASAAGTAALKALLEQKYSGKIIWIADQLEDPYFTTKLPSIFEQTKTLKDISFFYPKTLPNNVTMLFGKRVTEILPDQHVVRLHDGQVVVYDKLLLAIGMEFELPPEYALPNIQGIFKFGRFTDIQAIETYIQKHNVRSAVVVGLGLTGVDTLNGLIKKGIKAHIVQRSNKLLDRYVNDDAQPFICASLEKNNIDLHLSKTIQSLVVWPDNRVQKVVLNDGTTILCDMVIVTTGLILQEKLLQNAKIQIEQNRIWVNSLQQTSRKDIFAAGDCALITDITTGALRPSAKWVDAQNQGIIAAHNMSGAHEMYQGSTFVLGAHFLDTVIVSCGPINKAEHFQSIIKHTETSYALFLLKDECLKGFLLINLYDKSIIQKLRQFIEDKSFVTKQMLEALLPKT